MAGFGGDRRHQKPRTKGEKARSLSIQSAIACFQRGDYESARCCLVEIIEQRPHDALAFGALATVEKALERHGEAARLFQISLELDPDQPDILHNYAGLLSDQRQFAEAVHLSERAVRLFPNSPDYHQRLAFSLWKSGRLDRALHAVQWAIHLRPDMAEAYRNLGGILRDQGKLHEARAATSEAIRLAPDSADSWMNLGVIFKDLQQLDLALEAAQKAIVLRPDSADAHANMGVILAQSARIDQSIASFRRAISLRPYFPDAHFNLALNLLLIGQFSEGLRGYECRFDLEEKPVILSAAPVCTRWDGSELPRSASLLLMSEQGLGDTLQFMRYVHLLREKGLQVSICAPAKLHPLIVQSGIDASPLHPHQAKLVDAGYWLPLLSLPLHLSVTPENPILVNPYIQACPQRVEYWRPILRRGDGPVVAINWQGNPDTEKTNLRGRSLPLEAFAPIARQTSVQLLSLQKGYGEEQLEACSFRDRFLECQDLVSGAWDFTETAAIIANCDLVISSDTAVAHLAAGMGKPVWLLLTRFPDWRWGLEGDQSPWYPSMRLFRQRHKSDWDEVMQRVLVELSQCFPNLTERR